MARTRPDHAAEALLSTGRALFSLAIVGLGIETLVCSTLCRSLRRTSVPSHLCAPWYLGLSRAGKGYFWQPDFTSSLVASRDRNS